MESIKLIILLSLIALSFYSFRRDKNQYELFARLTDDERRLSFYKRWTLEPFLLYGALSIIVLFIIGEERYLMKMPEFLVSFLDSFSIQDKIRNDTISGIIKGVKLSLLPMLIIGSTLATILHAYNSYKDVSNPDLTEISDNNFRNLDPFIPRNYNERFWGAILSLNAGFAEELFFRLLAPILIYAVTGSALLAIIGSTIWFGLGHYYQNVSGVLVSCIVGFLLFMVYLITQNIWLTMLVHAILDLNGMVLSPWLKSYLHSKELLRKERKTQN